MQCPFLTGKYMMSCTANKEVYIPSMFELDEYCRHARHTMCPLYCKDKTDEKTVTARNASDKHST